MLNLNKRWQTFSAAPHRLFFFAGAVQALLTIIWWFSDLGGRFTGLYAPISWTISPLDAHAFLMIYAFFSFFIFGFLMTTYPRWMNGEEVNKRQYSLAFILLSAGTVLFYIGLVSHVVVLKLALLVFLAGWAAGLYALLRVYLRAKHPDKRHATITTVMLILAWLMIAGFTSGQFELVQLAKTGGIWLFLLPLFFAISHRMIPFFSANVIIGYDISRPYWALSWVLILATAHAVMEILNLPAWLWLVDLPMAVIGFYLTTKWQILKSLSTPLLAMVHIGFAWFGIAMLLYAMQSLYLSLTGDYILLKAPLHALVIGYFSSMLLAMATRVTLGHSGRVLAADLISWAVFLVFQLVALLRVIADFPGIGFTLSSRIYIIAAVIWLLCFVVWVYKFLPIYIRPRSDGRPG
ncbi:NnrS family protein [Methylophaga sp. OBS4]|uniref:NnrS family protein n=1 Tax=Methylophaga sp. OBS4 TaxID=2991935 RepID=UPI0022563526|nr:NnrS family protein [Methylophaga sp. OBS4]MCX4186717.1 NnrS family protein [Methylophaga sp. OBS4]